MKTMIQHENFTTYHINEFYLNLFNNKGGGCFKIIQWYIGCNILDHLFLNGKENYLQRLYLHVDKIDFLGI